MYACLIQSTSISLPSTSRKGPMICPVQSGKMVKLLGRMLDSFTGVLEVGPPFPEPVKERPPKLSPLVSMIFLDAIIMSISHSWKRSTTSAHVS